MKKDTYRLSKKGAVLFIISLLFIHYTSFSQCTNPVPTGNSSQTFCAIDDSTVGDLVASGGTIAWYDVASGGNQLLDTALLFSGSVYYAENISGGGCSPRLEVTVTIDGDIPQDVDVFVGKCASSNPTIGDLSATGTNIEWYTESTGGTLLSDTEPLVDGETYWVQQTENGCTSKRFPTNITIIDPEPPTVDEFQTFCTDTNPTVGSLLGIGNNIIWYDTDTSSTPIDPLTPLIDGEDYWGAQSSAAFPCESTVRAKTTVILDIPPVAGVDNTYTACELNFGTPNLYDSLGVADITGTWSGPSVLTNGYLGTFDPAINVVGVYTYTVSSTEGACSDAVANITVAMTVIPPPTDTDVTTAFCEIDGATVADLSSDPNIIWYDAVDGTVPVIATTPLADGQQYWSSFTDPTSMCESASRLAITVVITQIPPPSDTSVTSVFCEIDGATVAELSSDPNIVWYDTIDGTTPADTTTSLADGQKYWSSYTDPTSTCESASRLEITVAITQVPPPTISDVTSTFCEIDGATVAELSSDPNIIWYDTVDETTPVDTTTSLADGQQYWSSLTEPTSMCESTSRLAITVVITQVPPPDISTITAVFCEIDGATVVDLSSDPNINWYDTVDGTTPVDTTTSLVDGQKYWSSLTDATSGCESASRLEVTVAITQIPPPTDTDVTTAFCEIDGATVADLSSDPNIIWYDAVDGTVPVIATTPLADGQQYWSSFTDPTSMCESASRLAITVIITQIPPPSDTSVTSVFCEIDGATVAELSSDPNIVWYDTIDGTTPVDTTTSLADGQKYWSSYTDPTSTCESASRLEITVAITQVPPPTISDVTSTFCEIDGATVAELSSDPNIIWYDTVDGTTPVDTTTSLADGQQYWSSLTEPTSMCESASRLAITVVITQVPPPDISTITAVFCEIDGATVADLSSDPNINWYDTVDGTTPVDTTTSLADGQKYWSSLTDATSGCESASRLEVTVAITQIPPPTISEVTSTFCETLNATVADLSADPNISWYDTINGTIPLDDSTALADGQKYWSTVTDPTSMCESASRLEITAVIIAPPPPPTASTDQNYCILSNATIADLSASGTNILWYASEIDTTPLSTDTVLVDGNSYWASQSPNEVAGCESLTRAVVNVTLIDPAPPVIDNSNQSFCASDNPTLNDINITANNAVWYDSNGNQLSSDTLLMNGDFLAADIDPNTGCESMVRATVSITLTDPGTPSIVNLGNEFCKIDKPTVADLNNNVSSANGGTITWYDAFPNGDEVFLSEALEEGATYYAVETNASNCTSTTPLSVTVTLEACSQYNIEVYDGFSPNGDGRNETFTITNLKDLYPNYSVEFFNRWGATVYTTNANKPDWNGQLNGNGELVPVGVYYVIINFNEPDRKPIQKRLYLSR